MATSSCEAQHHRRRSANSSTHPLIQSHPVSSGREEGGECRATCAHDTAERVSRRAETHSSTHPLIHSSWSDGCRETENGRMDAGRCASCVVGMRRDGEVRTSQKRTAPLAAAPSVAAPLASCQAYGHARWSGKRTRYSSSKTSPVSHLRAVSSRGRRE